MRTSIDARIAERLKILRAECGWSLDELAGRCGISRASLSRLENAEVSPTASVLGRLCAAHGMTLSRLMAMVETEFAPLVRRADQAEWRDPETGSVRRMVSPPAEPLNAELIECELPAGQRIGYPQTPRPGLEHHLYMLDGSLELTVEAVTHRLGPGDCLRYRLHGPAAFASGDRPAKYILAIV